MVLAMAQDDLVTAIDRLYAVSLEAFVAERTRLARELRKSGDRPAAARVAKLPKPTAAAWALNHVARAQSGAVEDWLGATATLREASTHAAGVGGEALRAAMAAHRAATAQLLDVVREHAQPGGRPLSEVMLDRVRTLLQAATAAAGLAEALRAGRMTEEKAPTEALVEIEPRIEPPAVQAPRRPPKPDPEVAARAARKADLEHRVDAAHGEVQRLHDEAARREAAADRADERLEEARRTLRRSESEATAAHAAVKDAEDTAAVAERELHTLQVLLSDVAGEERQPL